MKCNHIAYYWKYPKRLSVQPTPFSKVSRNGQGWHEVCNGEIEIDLSTTLEYSDYGDGEVSGSEIRVRFRCNKCGRDVFPERNLPLFSWELEDFINVLMNKEK